MYMYLNRCISTGYFKWNISWTHQPISPSLGGALPIGGLGGTLYVNQEEKASTLPPHSVRERQRVDVRNTCCPHLRMADTANTTHPTA